MSEKKPLKEKEKEKIKVKKEEEAPEPIYEDYSTTFINFYWEHVDPIGYIRGTMEYLQSTIDAIFYLMILSKKLFSKSKKTEIKNLNLF